MMGDMAHTSQSEDPETYSEARTKVYAGLKARLLSEGNLLVPGEPGRYRGRIIILTPPRASVWTFLRSLWVRVTTGGCL